MVFGAPIASLASVAQPCIPAAPRGADEARTSRRTMDGLISAISCATKLPIEKPRRSALARSSASRKAIASRAHWATVDGVAPARPVHTDVVERDDAPGRGQRVDQRGAQLSRFQGNG